MVKNAPKSAPQLNPAPNSSLNLSIEEVSK